MFRSLADRTFQLRSRLDAVLSGGPPARTGSARSARDTRDVRDKARDRPAASAPPAQSADFDNVSNSWFLVQMLLRHPVHSEADLQYVQQASVAADRYLQDIREMAPQVRGGCSVKIKRKIKKRILKIE